MGSEKIGWRAAEFYTLHPIETDTSCERRSSAGAKVFLPCAQILKVGQIEVK
jgi:hypothetical protein